MKKLFLICFFSVWLNPAWAQANYSVEIHAPPELAKLLEENLDLATNQEPIDTFLLDEWVKATPVAVQKLLETEGYFSAKAHVQSSDDYKRFAIDVEPGSRTLVQAVKITVSGEIRDDEDYQERLQALNQAWTLPVGAPFRQDDWAAGKVALLRLLMADRYPLAHIQTSVAHIQPTTKQAVLDVEIDSGQRIVFGDIYVQGLKRYPLKVVLGMADFSKGAGYDQNRLFEYQEDLSQSPYFSSAIVTPDFAHITHHEVPIKVEVVEVPRQRLELGLTYDSVDGPGARIGYDYYNIFKRGYTGSLLTDVRRDRQQYSIGLGFPRSINGYSQSVTASYKNQNVQNVRTRLKELGFWGVRNRNAIEARLGIELLSEAENVDDVLTRDTHALQLVYGWTRTRLDDVMRPRNGTLLRGQLSVTPGKVLSSTAYVRAYGKAVGYWSPSPKVGIFVGRLELGQVWAKDGEAVPSSILFRAGGANSVRGYEFESLGLPGPNGSVLGGRVLATGSLEYQIPIRPNWYFAIFEDVGNVADSWKSFSLDYAHGVGLRWMSPFAPFALDIAKAQSDGKIRWNLSLGLAF